MATPRFIVVGGGLAGLMATIRIAEKGYNVDLFSTVPVKRSHSVCAQGGINAAKNLKGEGDSIWQHFDDTVYGGDFLANQPIVKRMCEAAPGIIDLFDRMGVTFNRTPEGLLDFRRFGGTRFHRTAFAGATTGQQLIYALDEQVRRHEAAGLVSKFEGWEMLSGVIDNKGIGRGIVAMNMTTMETKVFPAEALIMATGGIGLIFGRKSTNSMNCTGSAVSALYQQGMLYANGEFIQVHPTAIPGEDKLRLMSESARGEGGRLWVPRADKPNGRWYFLEEKYPKYGNLLPRDIATREIFQLCLDGYGVDGKMQVYLDVSHIPRDVLERKLEGILEIYEKFIGDDPHKVPMRVFPAMHYTMGGMWVDGNKLMSNLPGIFGAGECNYQHHGANRLGANSLVSCVFDGMVCGDEALNYAQGLTNGSASVSSAVFEAELKRQNEISEALWKADGKESPYDLWLEMGKLMSENCTVIRYNDKLEQNREDLIQLQERYKNIHLEDRSKWSNQGFLFARALGNMLHLARVINLGALLRNESRGAHYKPDFPERNDAEWLKTTLARLEKGEPKISYEPVDTSLLPPRQRKYD